MKLKQWLDNAQSQLEQAGIGSARLDALILLEDLLHKDRAYLLAEPKLMLSTSQVTRLNKHLQRRAKHEPLSYIRGFSEFYGRRFKINRHVLEPRPESETMIDLLKALSLKNKPIIADIGTGSGALGITTALEIPSAEVNLYDIDSSALAVARHNCILHELHLHAYKRDLLNHPIQAYNVILANLPYVPNTWKINEGAKAEPKIAIFGGTDGLDLYRRFFTQLQGLVQKPNYVLTESMPPQHIKLAIIAKNHGYKLREEQDFIQVFQLA